MSLLKRASEVYAEEGVLEVVRGARDFLSVRGKHRARNKIYGLPVIDDWCYRQSVQRFEAMQQNEESIEDAFETAYSYTGYGNYQTIQPMQGKEPLQKLLERAAETEPDTAVEIGTARGGAFYLMVRYLQSAERFVSVNLGWSHGYEYKIPFLKKFDEDRHLHFISGNSHSDSTFKEVSEYTDENVDFLFIDGDHSYSGVKEDFEMYKQLVKAGDGGMIAFHDIQHEHPRVGVDEFWDEIKPRYDTEEIDVSPEKDTGGIGILYL